ncbi:MAG: PH domain-containing protein [Patescibacteria group bacterium]
MAWFGMFSYYGNISEEGLVLSDIFGKKIIPWDDILRVKTTSHNEDFWAYIIVTNDNKYIVRADCDDFESLLVEKALLELYKISKMDPKRKKIWKKIGHSYKHINFQDLLDDKFHVYNIVR